MKWLVLLMTCWLGVICAEAADKGFDSVDGPNVRVMHNDDGSRTVFTRSPDNRVLTKRTFTGNGALSLLTIYRMDKHGNPTGCKIFDGRKTELYKTSYGYHKDTGKLVEERMFDSRVKRINPDTGEEMPVRRFIYNYDALGNRSAPIAITLIPGKTAEEVYGKPTALDSDPFEDSEGN
jgi:hypothetical protein